jgi:hypothetical protein
MANDPNKPPAPFKVKLTHPEQMYNIEDVDGSPIPYEAATGRDLFKHARHRMTDYDDVLDQRRQQQGHVSGREQKIATKQAAEQVLELYRDEHVKVIQDAQTKGFLLQRIMQKAGVNTAQAVVKLLDSTSEKLKDVANLEDSQRALRVWNDTYRVQRELVKKVLVEDGVPAETLAKVNALYGTRSSNKAMQLGEKLLNLENSEILKLVKSAIRYAKS